jgi:hypothetical protein
MATIRSRAAIGAKPVWDLNYFISTPLFNEVGDGADVGIYKFGVECEVESD